MLAKNITETVNVNGKSGINGDKWIIEKIMFNPHTITAHIPPRYKPYWPRDGLMPLELQFTARTTGPSSHLSMTVEDAEEVNMTFDSKPRPLLIV